MDKGLDGSAGASPTRSALEAHAKGCQCGYCKGYDGKLETLQKEGVPTREWLAEHLENAFYPMDISYPGYWLGAADAILGLPRSPESPSQAEEKGTP